MYISALQSERKISFVLHEPDNESEGSSNTTVTMQVGLHMQMNIDSISTGWRGADWHISNGHGYVETGKNKRNRL